MRRRLESGVGECRTVVEAQFEKVLRDEGYRVFKPEFPRFLVVSPKGEIVFVEGLRFGERLGRRKKIALTLLARMGFKVELLCQSKKEKRIYHGLVPVQGLVIPPPQKFEPFITDDEKKVMSERVDKDAELESIIGGIAGADKEGESPSE